MSRRPFIAQDRPCRFVSAKKRECPRCWVALVPEKRKVPGPDITVDVCPNCSGEYLDKGEIKKLTRNRDLHTLLTKHLGVDSDSELVCPGCGGVMDAEYLDADKETTIEVDVCLTCNGVWLDDGELAKLAKSETDFSKLSDEKLAELFDASEATRRQKAAMGGLFGMLRKRR